MEKTNWPVWLSSVWPAWLQTIGYPAPGVGDLDDLKLNLGVGEGGKWVGFINPGWFYANNLEQYNYIVMGTKTVSGVVGSGTISEPISFRPTWGPVLVASTASSSLPYREHHNTFYPAAVLSWTLVGSGFWIATLPASSILVSMRDTSTLPMGSVAGTGLITNERLYWYDIPNNQVWVQPKVTGSILVFADIIYTTPLIRMREVVAAEVDGVRASYNQIEDIYCYSGTASAHFPNYQLTNLLVPSIGANVGDWVILDYLISQSFVLKDHQTINYYAGGVGGPTSPDNIIAYYETSVPDILPNVSLASNPSGVLNFNPIYPSSYRAGYLFHANPASALTSYWGPAKINVFLSKDVICTDWNEVVKLTITLVDTNSLPVPDYPVTVTVSGGSALLMFPGNGATDGRGEINAIIQPGAIGTLTVLVSSSTLSASISTTICSSGTMIDVNKWNSGQVNLIVTNDRGVGGGYRTFVNATDLSGVPKVSNVTLYSKLASQFVIKSGSANIATATSPVVLPMCTQDISNLDAIEEVSYLPQPNDTIVGLAGTAQSVITKGASQ